MTVINFGGCGRKDCGHSKDKHTMLRPSYGDGPLSTIICPFEDACTEDDCECDAFVPIRIEQCSCEYFPYASDNMDMVYIDPSCMFHGSVLR